MKKETEQWMNQAQRDILSAQHCFESKDYYLCAFVCQQAVEKSLKAFWIEHDLGLLKTHDLTLLARKMNAPLEILKKCALLGNFYTATRYPDTQGSSINKEMAIEALAAAKEVLQWSQK